MFASLVLYSWPVVVLVLFQKYRISVAVLATIVAGYLLLPSIKGLNLPLLPVLDKNSIPAFAAFFFALMMLKKPHQDDVMARWFPQNLIARIFLLGLVVGAFMTVLTNPDPIFNIPGLRPYDGFSTVLATLVMLTPFFLAYRFLAGPAQHKLLLVGLCIAGLCYSILALYEIRMSPQLNWMVYDFFPHSWIQHVRSGGFRPLVFLEHGLWLAIFFVMTIIAACGAARVYPERRNQFLLAAGWLFATLALSNSLGSLAIAVALAPVVIFLPLRLQLLTVAIIGVTVITYPILRERGLIKGDFAVSWARSISEERAGSLEFRLDNENILLAKANERPLFGWGGWGRPRVYDEKGQDISITDGYWVIIFGAGGWTRYLSEFGLMILPLGLLFYRRKRYDLGPETGAIALILSANLIDLIPNGTMTPITWLVAGSLWGRIEWQGSETPKSEVPHEDLSHTTASPYTRQLKRINRH